jgi:hypothetical protein
MTTKLTLSLDDKIIAHAKRTARKRGKSLSKMVEEYFRSIPGKKDDEASVVERLEKRIKPYLDNIKLPENADYKKIAREEKYRDYLK